MGHIKTSVKLVSINIENTKHLDRVLPFVQRELPDTLCLQEVCEDNLSDFKKLGYEGAFAPIGCLEGVPIGTSLLTRHPVQNIGSYYYHGSLQSVCEFDQSNISLTQQKALIHADIVIDDEIFTIATTHFTWTPDGSVPNPDQVTSMEKFLTYISTLNPHVICGDFNIPRHHNSLYSKLTEHYTDAIPAQYASSLDRSLHRAGSMPERSIMFDSYMVDYVFTQGPYRATDVRLEFGISDHAGVVATITKEPAL